MASSPRLDQQFHQVMSESYGILASESSRGLEAFKRLLTDESPHVRSWVAADLLARGDVAALPVLQELACLSGFVGFAARRTIQAFEGGGLQSPFGSGHTR
jgi:hypothetical protein